MNINETINSLFALQGELTNSWCFVNGQIAKLADIEKMGYDEFSTKCRLTMPLKLYKYFSNKECMLNGQQIILYKRCRIILFICKLLLSLMMCMILKSVLII